MYRESSGGDVGARKRRNAALTGLAGCFVALMLLAGPLQVVSGAAGRPVTGSATLPKQFGLTERGTPAAAELRGAAGPVGGSGGFLGVISPFAATTATATPAGGGTAAGPAARGAVAPAVLSPVVLKEFGALGQKGYVPADPQIAVNASAILEIVNSRVEVFNKAGTVVSGPVSLAAFLGVSHTDLVVSPQALYDSFGKRFVVSAIDYNLGRVLLDVSKTNSAVGSYYRYYLAQNFGTSANTMNSPTIGLNNQEIGLNTNNYNATSGTYIGTIISVASKHALESGTFSVQFAVTSALGWQTLYPSTATTTNLSGTPTLYWASTLISSNTTAALTFGTTGVPPSVKMVDVQAFLISNTGLPPRAPQAGSSVNLSVGDDRVLSASWAFSGGAGLLWFTYATACVPAGDSTVRSCLRVDAIDTSYNLLIQDTDTGLAGYYLFYGALTALAGTGPGYLMILGFSGPLSYPGVALSGQSPTDPYGSFRGPTVALSGVSYDNTGAYGGYAGAEFDYSAPPGTLDAWGVSTYDKTPSTFTSEIVHFGF